MKSVRKIAVYSGTGKQRKLLGYLPNPKKFVFEDGYMKSSKTKQVQG